MEGRIGEVGRWKWTGTGGRGQEREEGQSKDSERGRRGEMARPAILSGEQRCHFSLCLFICAPPPCGSGSRTRRQGPRIANGGEGARCGRRALQQIMEIKRERQGATRGTNSTLPSPIVRFARCYSRHIRHARPPRQPPFCNCLCSSCAAVERLSRARRHFQAPSGSPTYALEGEVSNVHVAEGVLLAALQETLQLHQSPVSVQAVASKAHRDDHT